MEIAAITPKRTHEESPWSRRERYAGTTNFKCLEERERVESYDGEEGCSTDRKRSIFGLVRIISEIPFWAFGRNHLRQPVTS